METGNIIERLFISFSELEVAIASAKRTLSKKDSVPKEVVERLNSYDDILSKQRNLALDLRKHIEIGDWDEVNRHVNLINGLSSMIRDDARAILTSLKLNSDNSGEDEISNFC